MVFLAKTEMKSRDTSLVLRRLRPLAGSFRYYPYTRTFSGKEDIKAEVMRLGVEFSVHVAQSMLLLCDDIPTLSWFCYMLWKGVIRGQNHVLERLLRVMHFVYSKYIKPKRTATSQDCGNSVQWELIRNTWKHFADGVIILNRFDWFLRTNITYFDERQLSSAIDKYKQQVLEKLDDKLRSLSEVNGFAKVTIESNISALWKSLFDDGETISRAVESRFLRDLFMPIFRKPLPRDILAMPVVSSPYILGKNFETEELKEESVRLGVELSLYVAQSMFSLCDDIRTMLWFCYRLWRDAKAGAINEGHVMDRLLLVMHYVYTKYIKPTNGVYQIDGNNSARWGVMWETDKIIGYQFRMLNCTVYLLKAGGTCGREATSSPVEEGVKKLVETLECVRSVSKAYGFARDAMETDILDMWKSLFDTEAKEARHTLRAIKQGIIHDLFLPLFNEAP
ncbi:hypothetical protein YC2023_036497 [Brassica napus]